MTRIAFRSSAGVAVVAATIATVLLLGADKATRSPVVPAQGQRAAERPADPGTAQGPVRVTAVSPTVEELHRVTTQPAHVEAYERTGVYAKASGFVSKVLVDIGDRVKEKDVLAELWIPEMDQQQLQKAALVEQARAALEQAKARLGAADALIASAEAKLVEAEASITQHTAEVAFRRSEHVRIANLARSGSVTASLEDEKLNQRRASESALAAAQAHVRSAEAEVKVEQARKLQAQADVGLAEAQLKVAEADLKQTEILMQYAKIRAPYAGLVTRRGVDSGDFVASATGAKSEPLFTVDRVDRLRIVFDVPEADSALLRNEQRASLVVDALKGRSFDGQVKRTAGVLDPKTRTLRVEAEVTDPDGSLRAGMFGMVTVTLAERPRTVMLPTRCLRYDGGAPFVFCVNKGVAEKRPVKLGYSDGIRSEVVEGLNSSDQVVVESRFPVRAGQAVEVALQKPKG